MLKNKNAPDFKNSMYKLATQITYPTVFMKKITLFIAMAIASAWTGRAQVSAYGFQKADGTYTEITDGTVLGTATGNAIGTPSLDNEIYPVSLPFSFVFNGVSYNSCNVSSNGFITFGATAPAGTQYTPISAATTYDGAISAWGGDLNALFDIGGLTGDLSWKEIGVAPNREFVVQFRNFRVAYTTSLTLAPYINFQISLAETTNKVKVTYGLASLAAGTGNTSTTKQIGLRGSVNTDFNNLTNSTTVLFTDAAAGTTNTNTQAFSSINTTPGTPNDGLTYTWTPASCIAPGGVNVSAITTTTATLGWNASANLPSAGYQYFLDTNSTPPTAATNPTGTVGAGVLTTNFTLLSAASNYFVWVRSNCGGDFSNWTPAVNFSTLCDAPTVTGTTPGSVCGQGSATLAATVSSGTINWYADALGGTPLATGSPFATPQITATKSYWVEAATIGSPASVGAVSPTAEGGTIGTQTVEWNINFTVLANTTLQSVDVYPITSGQTAAIIVRSSSGAAIATYPYTTNVSGGATAQTVVINHNLAPGNYQLYPTLPTGGVSRNTSLASYPYTSAVANITGNGFDATYFMGMYNWQFASVCASPRTEVVATVATAPAVAMSAATVSICEGTSSATIGLASGAADYQTFSWSPATGVTGDAVNGWVFNPATTTTYTLTASQTAGSLCAATTSVQVNVTRGPVVETAASTTICGGTSTTLTAMTEVAAPGVIAIGTAQTLSAATAQPTAFCNRFDQYWNQTIFTAAELTAAGLRAGDINSLTYAITTIGDGPNVFNFSIRIGATTNSTLSSFTTTGLNLVYGPDTYVHAIGNNTITFATPYNWDGVSNIIVDVRQDGLDSINNARTYYTATASPMTISAVSSTPSATTPIQGTNPAGTTSLNRLNVTFGGQVASTGVGTLDWNWTPGNLTGNAVNVSPAATTTYTVRGTNTVTGCYTEKQVVVNVNNTAAPTGLALQVISADVSADATIEDLIATGTGTIVWYASEQSALSGTDALPAGTVLTNGSTYYATQTVAGCISQTALAVEVTVVLGADSFEMSGLKYYPNPVANVFKLQYSSNITAIEVYNLVGQRILGVQPNAVSAAVDMTSLSAGTYLVHVKANSESKIIKVVKN
jgi:hypothetical protein